MKYFLVLFVLMLTACDSDPNSLRNQIRVKTSFEVDGCDVKYVQHPSYPDFYIARCGNTVTNTWQRRVGKSYTTEASINVNDEQELRNRLSEIETKNKALAKLSAEEKKALGVQ
jgi:hypothetical protein